MIQPDLRRRSLVQPGDDSPEALLRLWPTAAAPTPLLPLPRLAARCGVARILLKDESRRGLGNFKSLGGVYASLKALARAAQLPDIGALLNAHLPPGALPPLLCASDGNHGLAVATGALLAGTRARVYLPRHASPLRAQRLRSQQAEVVWVPGTYDDACDAAASAAERNEGLLLADTSAAEDDPIVRDVLEGYSVLTREIRRQLPELGEAWPTHAFVQAGVGGLAAAVAQGMHVPGQPVCRIVVVEPAAAACVGRALQAGRVERIAGDLRTSAEMLSCGEAAAPAVKILRERQAQAISVSEAQLADAVTLLAAEGGPSTTPSGAAGLAGLLTALPGTPRGSALGVSPDSRVLLLATERELVADAPPG